MFQQLLFGRCTQHHIANTIFSRINLQKIFCQQNDILSTLTQRRKMQLDGIQSIEEILSECSLAHLLTQISIRSRQNPHIHMAHLIGTNALSLPLLNHRQEFLLHRQVQISNLIQKESTAIRRLNSSFLRIPGIRKRPLLVSEKLALEKILRDTPQVDIHKRLPCPARKLMQGMCHHILSRTILSSNQYIGIRSRHTHHLRFQFLHGRAFANHSRKHILRRYNRLGIRTLIHIQFQLRFLFLRIRRIQIPFPAQFHGTLHRIEQFIPIPWFRNKVDGSRLDSPHRLLRVHVSRDKQHHALGVMRQNLLQPFIPLFATDGIPMEVHIEHDDIRHERIHHSDDSFRRIDNSDTLHVWFQKHIERQENILIVIHYQYLSIFLHCHHF